VRYGSAGAGSGSHVCALLLDGALQTKMTHVPYRGAGPAVQDLLARRLDFIAEQIATAVPQVLAGTVKALAVLGPERVSVLPHLPAAPELGLGALDCGAWAALVVPKGTPEPIVRRLAAAANDAVETPFVRERYAAVGVTIPARERRTPEYLATFVPAEIERWAKPILASGAVID
jgi:tripartite-type tricarboxylate transporter receptor subunit TctC